MVDAELDRIDTQAVKAGDPDQFGVYDQCEHVLGLGFVACQTYIESKRMRRKKSQVLGLGPRHGCNQTFAEIINASANYWKHRDGWERASLKKDAERTINILEAMGTDVWSSYSVSNTMQVLLAPHAPRFKNLLPFLKEWAENVINAA